MRVQAHRQRAAPHGFHRDPNRVVLGKRERARREEEERERRRQGDFGSYSKQPSAEHPRARSLARLRRRLPLLGTIRQESGRRRAAHLTADLTPSRAHLFASPETPGRTRSRQETIYQAGASAALPRLPALGQAARGGCVPPILIRCAVNNQCQTPHCCRLFGTNCKKMFLLTLLSVRSREERKTNYRAGASFYLSKEGTRWAKTGR